MWPVFFISLVADLHFFDVDKARFEIVYVYSRWWTIIFLASFGYFTRWFGGHKKFLKKAKTTPTRGGSSMVSRVEEKKELGAPFLQL